ACRDGAIAVRQAAEKGMAARERIVAEQNTLIHYAISLRDSIRQAPDAEEHTLPAARLRETQR
ncbi:MAG: hypothetical protein K2Q10_00140, partial [Rhodospirillales bacterium]|nr:hypothetical protein [Rhodospirillales bacterium]